MITSSAISDTLAPNSVACLSLSTRQYPRVRNPFTPNLINASTGQVVNYDISSDDEFRPSNNPFSDLTYDRLTAEEKAFFDKFKMPDGDFNFRVIPSSIDPSRYEVCGVINKIWEAQDSTGLQRGLQHIAEQYQIFNFIIDNPNLALTYRFDPETNRVLPIIIEGHQLPSSELKRQYSKKFPLPPDDGSNVTAELHCRIMDAGRTLSPRNSTQQRPVFFKSDSLLNCDHTEEEARWLLKGMTDQYGHEPLLFDGDQRRPQVTEIRNQDCDFEGIPVSFDNFESEANAQVQALARLCCATKIPNETRGNPGEAEDKIVFHNPLQLVPYLGSIENVNDASADLTWRSGMAYELKNNT